MVLLYLGLGLGIIDLYLALFFALAETFHLQNHLAWIARTDLNLVHFFLIFLLNYFRSLVVGGWQDIGHLLVELSLNRPQHFFKGKVRFVLEYCFAAETLYQLSEFLFQG